ncbi:BLUF domain-containing protein [Jannaschia sp. CCS1]|uniref:BLUF domain-containing protein n=1 Tax=Jannaschia sp. (strain CCS1) TaxID=290400 RepID=UPI000053BAA1|nr:BLUF domain-containing protein [Jannaschia sp. CCS1]ABD54947.1 BLUF [Jannaschia sp. CCS1]
MTDGDLLRVVYFSFQNTDIDHDEIDQHVNEILKKSQFNNSRANVTGALIFNAGVFGQILEGPITEVEDTFERIQMDERHRNVTVLDSARTEERFFPRWSMGFVGADRFCSELFGGIGTETEFDISCLSGQQMFETLHALTLQKEISHRAA